MTKTKYLINFVVEAKDRYEALDELTAKFQLHAKARDIYHSVEEYEEPTNWRKEAESYAEEAMDSYNLKEEVDKAVSILTKHITSGQPTEVDVEEEAQEIYDDLYQDEDLYHIASELADGRFIYSHTKGLMEALSCMDDLGDYLETDSGLWEGEKDPNQVILLQATYTLASAINAALEETIKAYAAEKIQEFLDKQGENA